jgi:hypothetical protein
LRSLWRGQTLGEWLPRDPWRSIVHQQWVLTW